VKSLHGDPRKQDRYCHCGRKTAYAAADYDQRSEWWMLSRKGQDWYWLTMPREFCDHCWEVRCDAYPGACHDESEEVA
jgi:hypothetical protein